LTDAVVTQLTLEVWTSTDDPPTGLLCTQVEAEFFVSSDRNPWLQCTQVEAEYFATSDRNPWWRVTQQEVEVWLLTRELGLTYPIYPTLPGLGYSVFWKPEFANAPTAYAANKAEIDLALAETPVHEFTLTYDFLRDETAYLLSPISNEFKRLFGFFLRLGANAGRFVFENPDDNATTQQEYVGETDGVEVRYGPIVRTFGVDDDVGVEPVGYVNLTQPVHVYLDGVEADPGTYEIDRTYPLNQKVHFFLAPSAGQDITIECSYYYYCKFAEDNQSFEKFMQRLWMVKQVTIRSNRGTA
jgi:hypothetical protein